MYVSYVCIICMYHMYVSYVCIICMYHMYVSYVCITCMNHMYVSYVCIICMYHMCVSYVIIICMYHMYVSYVCIICMYHVYDIYINKIMKHWYVRATGSVHGMKARLTRLCAVHLSATEFLKLEVSRSPRQSEQNNAKYIKHHQTTSESQKVTDSARNSRQAMQSAQTWWPDSTQI